ncbi:GLPGLI family protein [Neolewinella lacunae]|uniref:GLPGLI family protein n=1 Tax=Neolewinella lacunae TaxID=1517758 RepID=A0A923PGR0_9BACT|nr:GLPGLI family protein [Neolewinella lacunae]MBC6993750.1 GLPGLI family protein [Neolewinella lacunae]MDN3635249.1 GLPGLI family protein [Neolewinella lacunae]
MKIFLQSLILLLVSVAAFGQASVEVKYLQKKNPRVNDPGGEFFSNDDFATLVSNGDISTYRYGQGGEGKKVEKDDNNNIKITYSDAYGFVFHRDKGKRKFISRDLIKDQPFIITEDLAELKWEIQADGVREIGGYHCQMAVTEFRGRVYEAWFTTALPLDAGPWKLAGLPGLILEAKDRQGIIQFIFAGIRLVSDEEIDWNKPPRQGISIGFEEFYETRERKDEEFFQKIASYPGVTITPNKHKGYFEVSH